MSESNTPSLNLPAPVLDVVWRIFGAGASPMSGRSTFDLIEPVIAKRTSLARRQQTACIAEIRQWFESFGDRHWLRAEMREPVAEAIMDGIGKSFSDRAAWAVGSIDSEIVLRLLRARCWSDEEIEDFCSRAVVAVHAAIERDRILDASRASGYVGIDPAQATIPRDAIERESKLSTFWHLENHGWELVHHALDHAVSNLVELLVDLRPARVVSLIAELDHPVVQALAADHFLGAALRADHRAPLKWIDQDASDAVVALAIYHTLVTVNVLDDECAVEPVDASQHPWRTELRPHQDDLDSAARTLLEKLVQQLLNLASGERAKWLGELLSYAPQVLDRRPLGGQPKRIAELEATCITQMARCVTSDSAGIPLDAFRSGLSLTPGSTGNRHVADLAWALRADSPEHAQTIADAALDCHRQQIACDLADSHFYFQWNNWQDREWADAIGRAILLSAKSPSPRSYGEWLAARCLELPLSGWDAEERYASFLTADRVAQLWFLAAICAFHHSSELGQLVDPADVHSVARLVWAHCRYAEEHRCIDADLAVASEAAARVLAQLGAADDALLLREAGDPALRSRALWGLADQYLARLDADAPNDSQRSVRFADNFAEVSAARFGPADQHSLGSLVYWAKLWLRLGAHGPAEQTATAIMHVDARSRVLGREGDILIVKLLALATCQQRLGADQERHLARVYRDLWLPHTPEVERPDRATVDAYFGQSGASLHATR